MDPREYTDPPGGIGSVEEESEVNEMTRKEFGRFLAEHVHGYGVSDLEGRTGRYANFLRLLRESGLDYGGIEDRYDGGRYLIIVGDGGIGDYREADSLRDVAGNIGDYIECAYAVQSWYDLDEAEPVRRGWRWQVTVQKDDEEATEIGEN